MNAPLKHDSVDKMMHAIGLSARTATAAMRAATTDAKNTTLKNTAGALLINGTEILAANSRDMGAGAEKWSERRDD